MPRAKRITWLHFPHLIIAKANGSEHLFLNDEDYLFYLENLRQMVRERLLKVYAYCLLPKELRLVVLPKRLAISRIIQKLHGRYTIYLNKKLNRNGHLFNGRFKSIVFMPEDLPSVIREVHLWPFHQGQVLKAFNYPYSSYKSYINNKNQIDFIAHTEVFNHFNGAQTEQRQAFFKYVELFSHEQNGYGIEEKIKGLGGTNEILLKKAHIPKITSNKLSITTLAEQISLMLNISQESLKSSSRRQDLVLARRLLATVAAIENQISITQIAHFLKRDKSQISRLVSQGIDLLDQDQPFSLMFYELKPKSND